MFRRKQVNLMDSLDLNPTEAELNDSSLYRDPTTVQNGNFNFVINGGENHFHFESAKEKHLPPPPPKVESMAMSVAQENVVSQPTALQFFLACILPLAFVPGSWIGTIDTDDDDEWTGEFEEVTDIEPIEEISPSVKTKDIDRLEYKVSLLEEKRKTVEYNQALLNLENENAILDAQIRKQEEERIANAQAKALTYGQNPNVVSLPTESELSAESQRLSALFARTLSA